MAHAAGSEDPTVLVVDDEPKIARLVRATLEPAGFEVLYAADGEAGVEMVESEQPDLVLLDVMMPRMNGIEALERIRELSDVPVLMLTARGLESDRVRGLELGADDYVVKPFSPLELQARIRALLRRARAAPEPTSAFDDGTLCIDLDRREVVLDGRPVSLTRTELRLLRVLAENPNRVFLHDELKSRVWGERYDASDELLRSFVRAVRKKIEPDPSRPRYLLTQPGIGYVFRRDGGLSAEERRVLDTA